MRRQLRSSRYVHVQRRQSRRFRVLVQENVAGDKDGAGCERRGHVARIEACGRPLSENPLAKPEHASGRKVRVDRQAGIDAAAGASSSPRRARPAKSSPTRPTNARPRPGSGCPDGGVGSGAAGMEPDLADDMADP